VFLAFFGPETDPIALHILFLLFFLFLLGDAVLKSLRLHHFKLDWDEIWQDCSSSKLKYSSIDSQISDMMSYFQDGGHDICLLLLGATSTGCPLATQAHVA